MLLRIVLYVVAASQFMLGALTLAVPGQFAVLMGLSAPPPDNGYLSAMLAARFLVLGAAMVHLARQKDPDRYWVRSMVAIQLIDFMAGAAYLASGLVSVGVVALPMFNAALFAALLVLADRRRPALPA